ncbi:MAG: dihydrolipoyl dehydrogenase [Bdellovibrionales bacterium]
MIEIDVAIIGAGSAGLAARREIAKKSDSYLVFDGGPLGTTCARVGCMPSKALIELADKFHSFELGRQFLKKDVTYDVDVNKAMARTRELRDYFTGSVKRGMESWQSDKFVNEFIEFTGRNTLKAGDKEYRFKKAVIAIGTKPIMPGPWREYQSQLHTTDNFFELENIEGSWAVIGLGVIGLELGQALKNLNLEVHAYSRGKTIAGLSSKTINAYAADYFAKELNANFTGVDVVGREGDKVILRSGDGIEKKVDNVLVAIGRSPNFKSLNLEAANVPLDERGVPSYDSKTFRILESDMYLVGDANMVRPLLHEAADEGRIAGFNAVRAEDQCFARRTMIGVTFSHPNISTVGQSKQQIEESGVDFVVGEVSFEDQGRARTQQKNKGLLEVYAEKKTGVILGAEIFAPSGEHLAHLLAWAISMNLDLRKALSLPFYHPVIEEGLRTALRDALGKSDQEVKDLEVLRCEEVDPCFNA